MPSLDYLQSGCENMRRVLSIIIYIPKDKGKANILNEEIGSEESKDSL
jgi:hypothetical protein